MDEDAGARSSWSEPQPGAGSGPKVQDSHIAAAAFVLRRLPLAILQPAVDLAVGRTTHRHPSLMDALSGLGDGTVLIDPTDVPVRFLIRRTGGGLAVRCVRQTAEIPQAKATISGTLAILVGLAEGEIDGDALFFTRDLTVRGDTGMVLTLRNAMERSSLTLTEEIRSVFGPLTAPLFDLTAAAGGVLERLDPLLPAIGQPLCPPAARVPDGTRRLCSPLSPTGSTGNPEPHA